jgi:hypothetical protein
MASGDIIVSTATAAVAGAVDVPPGHQELGCKIYTFVLYVVVFGTMCVLGFIGNTLSFIVLHFDRQSHAATFLLQVMAAVDNVFLVTTGMSQMFPATLLYVGMIPNTHPFNPYLQTFVWPVVHIAQLCTVYITVLIASNRYIAICHPYKAERLCSLRVVRIQVLILFCAAFIYNVPRFFEYEFPCVEVPMQLETAATTPKAEEDRREDGQWVSTTDGDTTAVTSLTTSATVTTNATLNSTLECGESSLKKNNAYRLVYESVLYSIVVYLGPLLLIIFFNTALVLELINTRAKRRQSSAGIGFGGGSHSGNHAGGGGGCAVSNACDDRAERNNITLVMCVIIVVFLATQTPAYINQVLGYFLPDTEYQCGRPYFYYYHVSNLIVSANSSLNFVVYCVCRRNFRDRLRNLRCACCCCDGGGGGVWGMGGGQGAGRGRSACGCYMVHRDSVSTITTKLDTAVVAGAVGGGGCGTVVKNVSNATAYSQLTSNSSFDHRQPEQKSYLL